jgi:hypothetical protein
MVCRGDTYNSSKEKIVVVVVVNLLFISDINYKLHNQTKNIRSKFNSVFEA